MRETRRKESLIESVIRKTRWPAETPCSREGPRQGEWR